MSHKTNYCFIEVVAKAGLTVALLASCPVSAFFWSQWPVH